MIQYKIKNGSKGSNRFKCPYCNVVFGEADCNFDVQFQSTGKVSIEPGLVECPFCHCNVEKEEVITIGVEHKPRDEQTINYPRHYPVTETQNCLSSGTTTLPQVDHESMMQQWDWLGFSRQELKLVILNEENLIETFFDEQPSMITTGWDRKERE